MRAVGLIESALTLKTLSKEFIPQTIGLIDSIDNAIDWISLKSQECKSEYALTVNARLGRINAGIIFKKEKDSL
jgi:3-oxoacyl-(acyl-carrier-protein) synthase